MTHESTNPPFNMPDIISEYLDIFASVYTYAQDCAAENKHHYKAEDLALEVV